MVFDEEPKVTIFIIKVSASNSIKGPFTLKMFYLIQHMFRSEETSFSYFKHLIPLFLNIYRTFSSAIQSHLKTTVSILQFNFAFI